MRPQNLVAPSPVSRNIKSAGKRLTITFDLFIQALHRHAIQAPPGPHLESLFVFAKTRFSIPPRTADSLASAFGSTSHSLFSSYRNHRKRNKIHHSPIIQSISASRTKFCLAGFPFWITASSFHLQFAISFEVAICDLKQFNPVLPDSNRYSPVFSLHSPNTRQLVPCLPITVAPVETQGRKQE